MQKTKFSQEQIISCAFIIITVFIGFLMRILMFPLESNDMKNFLLPWCDYIADNGGIAQFGGKFGDYTPAYYYILTLINLLPFDKMYMIKAVSCVFDFVTALFVMKTVMLRCDKSRAVLSFAAAFILPSAVLNSAAWGQCDSIFTAFVVISLYCVLKGKDLRAMAFFGVAFSFKLQAVFFAPFILFVLLKKRIRLRSLLLIPAVYVGFTLPALFAGADFLGMLTVYFRQAGEYPYINLCLPNIWIFFRNAVIPELAHAGIAFAAAVTVAAVFYLLNKKHGELSESKLITAAFLLTMLVPYVLPYMHERYFYLSDMLCVIFVFMSRGKAWVLFVTQFCAVQCAAQNLFQTEILDFRLLAAAEFAVLLAALYEFRTLPVLCDTPQALTEREENEQTENDSE